MSRRWAARRFINVGKITGGENIAIRVEAVLLCFCDNRAQFICGLATEFLIWGEVSPPENVWASKLTEVHLEGADERVENEWKSKEL